MAKGKWVVMTNHVAGVGYRYIAARVRDTGEVVHSGNLEYCGNYSLDREQVRYLVEQLNKGEEQRNAEKTEEA